MQSNTLSARTKRITSARVGRGGKRGKTSGRGTKGQSARAGNSKRPEYRDMIKKLPKLRGHGKNRSRTVGPTVIFSPVNLTKLEAAFSAGDTVSPVTLMKKNLLRARGGFIRPVKILGTGTLTKKLTVVDCAVSDAGLKAIEAAGGALTHGS